MTRQSTDSSARRGLRPTAFLLLLLGFAVPALFAQTGSVAAPYRVGGAVTPPELLSRGTGPAYTEEARRARVQGVVIVEVIIDERGAVTSARVLKGLPMGLDAKALEMVRTWRYKPATFEGKPVAVYLNLTVNFALEDGGQATRAPNRAADGATPEKILGRRAVPTEASVRAGIGGDVIVEVEIDEKGNVVGARVVKGLPLGLDQQALDAVRTWKFKPATQDGRAVKVRTHVTVSFPKPAPRP
jgi:TonB family protein